VEAFNGDTMFDILADIADLVADLEILIDAIVLEEDTSELEETLALVNDFCRLARML